MALSEFEIAIGGLTSIPVVGGLIFLGYKSLGESSLDTSKLKPKKKPAVTKVEKKTVWDIKKSVFMPRTHHSDSRNMLQTNGVILRALKRDWAKVREEDRFWKFVFTHDDDTNSHSSQAELERELRADPKELAEHVMLIDLARNDVGKISKMNRSFPRSSL